MDRFNPQPNLTRRCCPAAMLVGRAALLAEVDGASAGGRARAFLPADKAIQPKGDSAWQ